MSMLEPQVFLSPGAIGAAIETTVANIDSPTELNSLGVTQGELRIARTVEAGDSSQTLYYLDTTSSAQNLPYIVTSATAGLKWLAVAGHACNQPARFGNTVVVVDGNFTIVGSSDATKKVAFEADTQTTGFTFTWDVGAQTASRTLTAPILTGAATIATLSETQTLTGLKTFSAITTVSNTTAASAATAGALVVGNGSAATSVAVGGGAVNIGAGLTVAGASGLYSVVSSGAVASDYIYKISNSDGAGRGLRVQPGADSVDGLAVRNAAGSTTTFSVLGSGALATLSTVTHGDTVVIRTTTALTNGAAAQLATITNGPTAGNPTKWIPIVDNGTTRYIPAW